MREKIRVKHYSYKTEKAYVDWAERYIRFCLLYTSDAADERSSVDLGGRRIIKKKNKSEIDGGLRINIITKTDKRDNPDDRE